MDYLRIFKCLIITLFLQLNQASSNGIPSISRLFNGQIAENESFPYFANLWGDCGGAIISARWILTAARCVDSVRSNLNNYKIYVGSESLNNSQGVHFDKVIIHPDYKLLFSIRINDIALLRLTNSLTFSNKVQPVDISSNPRPRSSPTVSTGRDKTGPFESLKKVNFVRLTTEQCLKELDPQTRSLVKSRIGLLEKIIVCAKPRDPTPSLCLVDNGAPLVDKNELIGLVSFMNAKQCEDSSLGLFVNVATYITWIRKQTGLTLSG